jgi:hypothetical protein
MMNAKTITMMTAAATILTFASSVLAQPGSASDRCRQVKGAWTDGVAGTAYTGGAGTITQGGVLDGTTVVVYDPAFVYTPNPNFVAYISELTITTHQGQLRTSNVYLYDIVTNNLWTAIGYINPSTSTGKFAGAMGVLYFNGKTLGTYPLAVYTAEITGQICFAKGAEKE